MTTDEAVEKALEALASLLTEENAEHTRIEAAREILKYRSTRPY